MENQITLSSFPTTVGAGEKNLAFPCFAGYDGTGGPAGGGRSPSRDSLITKGAASMKPMPYQQVKERVDREDKVLKKLVIDTGIGMLAALLLALAVFR